MRNLLLNVILWTGLGLPTQLIAPFQEAVNFWPAHESILHSICSRYEIPSAELQAIISPELMRYNLLSDFFETKTLELFYVQSGLDYADFSIGRFQMKPSFVEKLEHTISSDPDLVNEFPEFKNSKLLSEKEKRQLRLKQLKSVEGQLKYAAAFYTIVSQRSRNIRFETRKQKVNFFASAFNFGFDKEQSQIWNWSKQEAFPYGKHYSGPQIAYGDLAILFYQHFKNSSYQMK